MKTRLLIFSLLISSMFTLLNAQERTVERELERLRTSVQRTVSTLQVLPDFFTSDARSQIENKLMEIRESFENAEQFVRDNRRVQARIAIATTYAKLREIEAFIKRHPVFRLKFQELLDRRIQDAELAIGSQAAEEALYMLNNAKSFRRKAYSFAQQDRTYSALEYFRLATYFADQAIRISQDDNSQRDLRYWQNYYSETELLLQRAKNLLQNSNRKGELETLMRKAERELGDVKQFTEERNFNAAKQKLTAVNRALYRIIDMVESEPESEDERMRMDVESIKFALSAAKEHKAATRPVASALIQRGNNLVRKIENHLSNQRLRPAKRQLFFANQLIVKLNTLLAGQSANQNAERLSRQLVNTKQSYSELKLKIDSSQDENGLLQLIETNLTLAEEAITSELNLKAALHLKIANRLGLQLNRILIGRNLQDADAKIAQENLQRLYDLLKRLEASKDNTLETRVSFDNAEELYKMASNRFKTKKYAQTMQLTELAINILTR
ncbi:MAG: hypothetical protein ACRBF0_17980 [Calditrichia bacterium]